VIKVRGDLYLNSIVNNSYYADSHMLTDLLSTLEPGLTVKFNRDLCLYSILNSTVSSLYTPNLLPPRPIWDPMDLD
jgi:hypothetical protein